MKALVHDGNKYWYLLLLMLATSTVARGEVFQMEYSERTRVLDRALCITARSDLPTHKASLTAAQVAEAKNGEVCQFRADLLVGGSDEAKHRSIEVSVRESMAFGVAKELCMDARWQLLDGEKIREVIGIGFRCYPKSDFAKLASKNPPALRRSEVMSYVMHQEYSGILGLPRLSGE